MNSPRGNAADLVTLCSHGKRSFAEITKKLEKRFGLDGQALTFRTQLRSRRRQPDESIAAIPGHSALDGMCISDF